MLPQRFPFRFVDPARVTHTAEGASYWWAPAWGEFDRAVAGPPLFVLLELAGQTAEIMLRHRLGPQCAHWQFRLVSLDRVTCHNPAPAQAELLVQVRADAGTVRLFRSAFTIAEAESVRLYGLVTHYALPGKGG